MSKQLLRSVKMKQKQIISNLGKVGLITSHSLAVILIGWYLLIKAGVVRYDAADRFGIFLLLSHPVAGLLLMIQAVDQLRQTDWNKVLLWGCFVSGSIAAISGIAWIQLALFFSSFSGTTFG